MGNQICLDCGYEYDYTPGRALGASSTRCSKCRKRDTKRQKYINLLMIAGNGAAQCRVCRYSKCTSSLILKDAVALLAGDSSISPEDKARRQYVLCLNCNAEIESNQVEAHVVNSKTYPVEVEFYLREVTIIRKQISSINYNANDTEIVEDSHGREAKRVGTNQKGLADSPAVDVPALSIE